MKNKKEYRVVYSLGPKCQTDIFLKENNLRRMSSLVGSAEIKKIETIKEIIINESSILFDPKQHIYTRFREEYKANNKKHGFRTIINKFDKGFDDATLPHQELWKQETKRHFTRAVKRLNTIKEANIPILFMYMVWERKVGENFKALTDEKALEDLIDWTGRDYNREIVITIINKEENSNIKSTVEEKGNGSTIIRCKQSDVSRLGGYLKQKYQLNNLMSIEDLEGVKI